LNPEVQALLSRAETVDITTIGRTTSERRRLEIWMYAIDGRYIITGTPGPRDWYANLLANPEMTLHLPGGIDLEATTEPVTDERFRRKVFTAEKTWWYRSQVPVDELVASSPMVEMHFPAAPTRRR
jgi:deazaflavin-dependent oxidoreductase (nitroreductase family)